MYANPQLHVDCEEFMARDVVEVFDPESPCARQYYQKQVTQLRDNIRALRVLDALRPDRGRLLEIGPFCGIFLNHIRSDGWQVVGLEPDGKVAQYARDRYGLEIIDGVLPHSALNESDFDAVVMLHVIEHMPDPSGSLKEIRRVLKPGGVVVIETPRFNSLSFKVLGRRERSVQNCQGHIFFFTEKTLGALLEKNGFRVVRVKRVGRTLTMDRFMYNLGLVARNDVAKRILSRTSKAFGLEKLRIYANFRDMQRMYARAV